MENLLFWAILGGEMGSYAERYLWDDSRVGEFEKKERLRRLYYMSKKEVELVDGMCQVLGKDELKRVADFLNLSRQVPNDSLECRTQAALNIKCNDRKAFWRFIQCSIWNIVLGAATEQYYDLSITIVDKCVEETRKNIEILQYTGQLTTRERKVLEELDECLAVLTSADYYLLWPLAY